jgi:hypothetical protein
MGRAFIGGYDNGKVVAWSIEGKEVFALQDTSELVHRLD